MGNCSACLSSEHYNYSSGEHNHDEADDLLRVSDDLSKPLLKPCILYNHQLHKGRLHMQGDMELPSSNPAEQQHLLAPASVNKTLNKEDKHVKVRKQVRFADEVLLISTSHQEVDPLISSTNEGETQELFHKKKNQNSVFINPSTILMDQSSNIVRVKVVISKKELSELMLKTREKQGSDALLARILAPPQRSISNISQTFHVQHCGSPTWRPSLEHKLGDLNPIDSAA